MKSPTFWNIMLPAFVWLETVELMGGNEFAAVMKIP
jgi:hypothetical protein